MVGKRGRRDRKEGVRNESDWKQGRWKRGYTRVEDTNPLAIDTNPPAIDHKRPESIKIHKGKKLKKIH